MDRILRDGELENHEIYFASYDQLNDPMENYKNIIWIGGKSLWTNFFKHYLLCLDSLIIINLLSKDNDTLAEKDINPFLTYSELPTDLYRERMDRIYNRFFEYDDIQLFIDFLSDFNEGISKNNLSILLNVIHKYAIKVVLEENEIPPVKIAEHKYDIKQFLKSYAELARNDKSKLEIFKIIFKSEISNLEINTALIFKEHINQKWVFPQVNYVDSYLNRIELLLYPEWYTACFMESASGMINWSHYSDGHRGVCLIYDVATAENTNDKFLSLELVYSISNSGVTKKFTKMNFEKVNYVNRLNNINFFDHLGNVSGRSLSNDWYKDVEKIDRDNYDLFSNRNNWREEYWKKNNEIFCSKIYHWEYEKEYRLILCPIAYSYENEEDRKIKYDFSQLHGLILGMKTNIDDKIEIIKRMKKLSNDYNRNDFKLYQAFYDFDNQIVKYYEIRY
jgi:hypothetical protein